MTPLHNFSDTYTKVDSLDGTIDGQLSLKEQTKLGAKFFAELTAIKDILDQKVLPLDIQQKLETEFISGIETIGLTQETLDLAKLAVVDIQIENFLAAYKQSLSADINTNEVQSLEDLQVISPDNKLVSGQAVLSLLRLESLDDFYKYSKLTIYNGFKFLGVSTIKNFSLHFPEPEFVPSADANQNNEQLVLESIQIEIQAQKKTVTPFMIDGMPEVAFYRGLPDQDGNTLKYAPLPPYENIEVFDIGGTYAWKKSSDNQSNFLAPFPINPNNLTGYFAVSNNKYIPVTVIKKNNKTCYKSKQGLLYNADGSVHENGFQHMRNRTYVQVGAKTNFDLENPLKSSNTSEDLVDAKTLDQTNLLTDQASPYQAEIGYNNKQTRTKLGFVENININTLQESSNGEKIPLKKVLTPDRIFLQQSAGFNTERLTPKQLKIFDQLGVTEETLKKMTLQEVQLTGLAWYQFGKVDQAILANLGLSVSLKDKSIYGLNINTKASLNWQKLKELQVLPEVVIDQKYWELIASGRYQAGYLKIPVQNTDYTVRMGVGALNGNVGVTTGYERRKQNGTLRGFEAGVNMAGLATPLTAGRFVYQRGMYMYGSTISTFVLDASSGIHQYQKNIAGTADIMEGEVVAYQYARKTKKNGGLNYMFQHLEKSETATLLVQKIDKQMQSISSIIAPTNPERMPLFFSNKLIRKIKKVEDLKNFSDGLASLVTMIKNLKLNHENLDVIRFKNIENQTNQKNSYNPHTKELVIHNLFDTSIKQISNEEKIGAKYVPKNESLVARLGKLDIQIFVDKNLNGQEAELDNFLAFATLYPKKFAGVDITIDSKDMGELCGWKQNNTRRRSTFRIHPKALEYFGRNDFETEGLDLDFQARNKQTLVINYKKIDQTAHDQKIEAMQLALLSYPIFTRMETITYCDAKDFEADKKNSVKNNKHFALVGNELLINIETINPKNPLKGIASVLGKKYWKSLEAINSMTTNEYRIMEFSQFAGQKNSRLLNLEPKKIEKNGKNITAHYQLKDYQKEPVSIITASDGTQYSDTFEIEYDQTSNQKTVSFVAVTTGKKTTFVFPDDIDTVNLICPSVALLLQRPELWIHLLQYNT